MNDSDAMALDNARHELVIAQRDEPPNAALRNVIRAGLALDRELRRVTSELEYLRARTSSAGTASAPGAHVQGHPLVDGHDDGGPRHFLGGRPVHAGDRLSLLTQLGWMPGRYERSGQPSMNGKFYFSLPGVHDATSIPISHGARLAWPDEIDCS